MAAIPYVALMTEAEVEKAPLMDLLSRECCLQVKRQAIRYAAARVQHGITARVWAGGYLPIAVWLRQSPARFARSVSWVLALQSIFNSRLCSP